MSACTVSRTTGLGLCDAQRNARSTQARAGGTPGLGVQPRQDQPFYWFRKEHEADLDALCKALDCQPADILEYHKEI